MNDYESALVAAGAKVLVFNSFGSYQGDWWAKVEYKGTLGWTNGSYGSCSGCDSFQAEFDYTEDQCEDHRFEPSEAINCSLCEKKKEEKAKKLAHFGAQYLDDVLLSQFDAEKTASKHLGWDSEAQEMLSFIQSNKL